MNDIDKIIEAARDAVAAYNDRFAVPGRKWVGPIDTEMEALRKALVCWQGAVARRSMAGDGNRTHPA